MADRRDKTYAAFVWNSPDGNRPMSVQGRIVLASHAQEAREIVHAIFSRGRDVFWDASREKASFSVIIPNQINQVTIVTEYDPYNSQWGPSETRHMKWKYHVMAAYVFYDCGQMEQQPDGSWVNLALQ